METQIPGGTLFINEHEEFIKLLRQCLDDAERGVWRHMTLTLINDDETMEMHHIDPGDAGSTNSPPLLKIVK